MRKVILIAIGALALAAPAAASSPSTLTVSMRDPGCHWFHVGGKYVKTYTHHGAVQLLNQDEATLIVKGPGGPRHDKVGQRLTLKAKGLYKITMVKQAPDDNHLRLTIK
jgi:hypothetical protein